MLVLALKVKRRTGWISPTGWYQLQNVLEMVGVYLLDLYAFFPDRDLEQPEINSEMHNVQ